MVFLALLVGVEREQKWRVVAYLARYMAAGRGWVEELMALSLLCNRWRIRATSVGSKFSM